MDKLRKRLKRIRLNLRQKILIEALEEAAEPIIDAAKQKAAVDTGSLRDSIKVLEIEQREWPTLRLGPDYREAPHAHLVEYGTVPRKLSKPQPRPVGDGEFRMVTSTGSAPAQPFLRPAFDEQREAAERAMARVIQRELEKLA